MFSVAILEPLLFFIFETCIILYIQQEMYDYIIDINHNYTNTIILYLYLPDINNF